MSNSFDYNGLIQTTKLLCLILIKKSLKYIEI